MSLCAQATYRSPHTSLVNEGITSTITVPPFSTDGLVTSPLTSTAKEKKKKITAAFVIPR